MDFAENVILFRLIASYGMIFPSAIRLSLDEKHTNGILDMSRNSIVYEQLARSDDNLNRATFFDCLRFKA